MSCLTDRSRCVAYQECPRKRYYAYEYNGTGVVSSAVRPELLVGSAVHVGLEHLLRGASMEDALQHALVEWAKAGEQPLRPEFRVHQSLMEMLLRAFNSVGKEQLLAEYDIISLEEEINAPLGSGVTFMSRPDGVLRSKTDGRLYALSFKTAAQLSVQSVLDSAVSMQCLSEMWAIQQKYGEHPVGVQYVYLIKGRKSDGISNTFLTHPWRSVKTGQFDWRFERVDPITGAVGRLSSSTWKRVNVLDYMPLYAWAEILEDWPLDLDGIKPFESVVAMPQPVYKSWDKVEDWAAQISRQEELVSYACRDHHNDFCLSYQFPQHLRSCAWPSRCSYYSVCHEGVTIEGLMSEGRMVPRTPNHELEEETANA